MFRSREFGYDKRFMEDYINSRNLYEHTDGWIIVTLIDLCFHILI